MEGGGGGLEEMSGTSRQKLLSEKTGSLYGRNRGMK